MLRLPGYEEGGIMDIIKILEKVATTAHYNFDIDELLATAPEIFKRSYILQNISY